MKNLEALNPFTASPQCSLFEDLVLPQTHFEEMDQRPQEVLLCGRSQFAPFLRFPTPEYTNDINYFKLIISKIVFNEKRF
ncbi:hypothetical protein SAMN02910340_01196 [Methanosarcina thermophila]|jgi:hypothetical protein|uniref:Uncharacterized protein n=1 Tax=Methanosarcina thermophila TaxID=2210 RepID=A0A1I6Z174_METTE|nr:hypothetical protein [Methanosarcina thermophila]ALK06308.1 MAG: hypothetical protein AAY43_12240 [Methanosarcina sp. 795]NLU57377.1 hypothetical protein [Methanosarcina thermophila]SFT56422.1 hypothetical protein SAMN02910340_01196 [Methanosarcina thermophila]HOA68698.1 hypothetical protein [Methanosarcina thermophila]HOQ65190.1 hypothetical protein [Methanosarcina thermophila]